MLHTALEEALHFPAPPAASLTGQATENILDTLWREIHVCLAAGGDQQ